MNQRTFLEELTEIRKIIEIQLQNRVKGIGGLGSIRHLRIILEELDHLEYQVQTDILPPKPRKRLTSTYIIINYWPNTSDPLSERLLRLDNEYHNL